MAHLTTEQLRRRERIESVIRLMAPGLDLVLKAGERLSRIVEREDQEYYPPRMNAAEELPPQVFGGGGKSAPRL